MRCDICDNKLEEETLHHEFGHEVHRWCRECEESYENVLAEEDISFKDLLIYTVEANKLDEVLNDIDLVLTDVENERLHSELIDEIERRF